MEEGGWEHLEECATFDERILLSSLAKYLLLGFTLVEACIHSAWSWGKRRQIQWVLDLTHNSVWRPWGYTFIWGHQSPLFNFHVSSESLPKPFSLPLLYSQQRKDNATSSDCFFSKSAGLVRMLQILFQYYIQKERWERELP